MKLECSIILRTYLFTNRFKITARKNLACISDIFKELILIDSKKKQKLRIMQEKEVYMF